MAEKKEKVTYSKSTAEVDLEARLGDDSVPVFHETVNPDPVSEDGYVGVSPEYQNAANETDEPLEADEGAFADAETAFVEAYGDGSEAPSEDVQKNYEVVKTPGGAKTDSGDTAPAEATTSESSTSTTSENK